LSAIEPEIDENTQKGTRTSLSSLILVPPIVFSLLYFVDVYLRASQKYFWFDELVTLYVCRLPIGSLWNALRHGIDFNPPLFFLVTDLSKAILGETPTGMRAPEMVGFWILCLCLYAVVTRRAGWLAGTIAMALPMVSGAFYYAYEARPHALVLGFCGLALLCWQMSLERSSSRRWLVAFSLCLLGAFLLHCYAILISVPFAAFELLRTKARRGVYWPMWIAMIAPSLIASLVYVPLLISYRSHMKGTDYAATFSPSIGALTGFYVYLVSPCILILIAACSLFAIQVISGLRVQRSDGTGDVSSRTPEAIVGAAFLFMPILGFVLAKVMGGPFIGRYFMSTLIGLCLLIGVGAGARRSANWVALVLITLLTLPVLWNFTALIWHRDHGQAEDLHEPSSGFTMNASLRGPLDRYQVLTSAAEDSRPIAVLDPLDYLYLLHYAPGLRSRLYYVQGARNDFAYTGYQDFQQWAPFKFNRVLTKQELLEMSPRWLVYGRTASLAELILLIKPGGTITFPQFSNDHFLADMEMNRTIH